MQHAEHVCPAGCHPRPIRFRFLSLKSNFSPPPRETTFLNQTHRNPLECGGSKSKERERKSVSALANSPPPQKRKRELTQKESQENCLSRARAQRG